MHEIEIRNDVVQSETINQRYSELEEKLLTSPYACMVGWESYIIYTDYENDELNSFIINEYKAHIALGYIPTMGDIAESIFAFNRSIFYEMADLIIERDFHCSDNTYTQLLTTDETFRHEQIMEAAEGIEEEYSDEMDTNLELYILDVVAHNNLTLKIISDDYFCEYVDQIYESVQNDLEIILCDAQTLLFPKIHEQKMDKLSDFELSQVKIKTSIYNPTPYDKSSSFSCKKKKMLS